MVLSARFLHGYSSVNYWINQEAHVEMTASESVDLYIQLVDLSLDIDMPLPGRRYCPPAGAILTVTIHDLDTSKVITRVASQPSPLDSSIWKLSVLATDALLTGSKSLLLVLNESGTVKRGVVHQGLRISPFDTSC